MWPNSLENIMIPSAVQATGEGCFRGYQSLDSVVFGADFRLAVIKMALFAMSSLGHVVIPSAVEAPVEDCFENRKKPEHVEFFEGSKLARLERNPFHSSSLRGIVIPSAGVIRKGCFSECESLREVTLADGSTLA